MAAELRTAQQSDQCPACIWMQAGIVKHKRCRLKYDCSACRFDKALRRVSEENRLRTERGLSPTTARQRITYWSDALLGLPVHRRPCVHSMKQRISFRSCTNDYACGSCEFDQYFQDQFAVHAVLKPVAVQAVHGVAFPQGYYLHKGHGWVRMESHGEVRIGLDAFATRLLGALDRIELPLLGKPLALGQAAIGLQREAWHTDLLAPITGVVTATNPKVREHPQLVREDPYGEGWLLMAHTDDLRNEMRQLLMGDEAVESLSWDIDTLYATIEDQLGPLAADGGQLGDDILAHLPRENWDAVARLFLGNPSR